MDSELHRRALHEQAVALRAAAIQAGPDAVVATCPGWDIRRLVQHMSRVYTMVKLALELPPEAERPQAPKPPADFDDVLTWFDQRLSDVVTALSTGSLDRSVWSFFSGGTPRTWSRRMAHETAIHRLDAEHALARLGPDHVHDLIFDPELAADGVDEMLTVLLPVSGEWERRQITGRLLFHAADAGRAWLVRFRPGKPPQVGAPTDAALEVEATVAGTADALYRRVWERPSTAVVTGDAGLAALVSGR